jgi:hypothetical protein
MGVGLSKSRSKRLHEVLGEHVECGDIPGLVALVSRDEDTHVEVLGTLAVGDPAPMDSPEAPKVFTDFWTLAYAALK